MTTAKQFKRRLLVSFTAILASSLAASQLWLENKNYYTAGWHATIAYLCIITTGGLGYYTWALLPYKWLRVLWCWLYAIVFMLLCLYKGIDFITQHSLFRFRSLFDKTRTLFISPLPFVLFYLMLKTLPLTEEKIRV
ncbi:MAG: hypothetical protein JSR37_08775 [Verrucomicrobia bacterium]|nr:hypothetical protein [Verrucomicrobiota bacterium]